MIASTGLTSRRKAEQLVQEGRVTVKDTVAKIGDRVEGEAEVLVDGEPLPSSPQGAPRLIAYNKPRGQIVSRSGVDTVFDHLPALSSGRWVNIGRLDVDSEGLLLMTDDGDLANEIAHPKTSLHREYVVRAKQKIEDEAIESAVSEGVSISGEIVQLIRFRRRDRRDTANHWYEIVVEQGRNRIVRRVFESLGATVNRLIRIRFGNIKLPRDLLPGQWRDVSSFQHLPDTELNRAEEEKKDDD